jgi:hypothetical protein
VRDLDPHLATSGVRGDGAAHLLGARVAGVDLSTRAVAAALSRRRVSLLTHTVP